MPSLRELNPGVSLTEIVPTRYSTGTARHTAIHAGKAQLRNLTGLNKGSGSQRHYHSAAANDVSPAVSMASRALQSKINHPQSTIGEVGLLIVDSRQLSCPANAILF